MKLRAPGDAAYRTITAGRLFGPSTTADRAYQAFANVTSIVQAGRSRDVLRRRRPGGDRRGSPRRVVAGDRLPLAVAPAAQPHGVRRAGRRRPGRPAVDHDQRVHDPGHRHRQRHGSGSSPTRATGLDRRPGDLGSNERDAAGHDAVAGHQLLQRRQRRQRHARHAARRRPMSTCSASTSRTSTRPASSATTRLGPDRPRQHQRALLPRRGHDGDRRLRPGLLPVDEDRHQPHRRRPGPGRRHPSLHRHVRQRRPGPGDQHVDRGPDPRRHDATCRARSTSRPA